MRAATRAIWAGALLAAPAAATAAPHDPGGDRIETFLWVNQSRPPDEPTRSCSRDRIWCAELRAPQAGERGPWELHVVARATDLEPRERRWRYVVPLDQCCAGEVGIGIWSEIVRDAWGGALIGLNLTRRTDARPGFFSNQRRLLLIHIPSVAGVQPYAVLETPLSGFIEQQACPYPDLPSGLVSEEDSVRIGACQDRFEFSTLFTLMPRNQPMDQPRDLIVATVAATSPGRRSRTPPGTQRAPVERSDGDVVRDPACTYTRSYYFDAGQGRYVPDAPLPPCRDYLEP